ncbi:HAD superfamily hydrolase (TIGR01509 family) [Aminobacter lissarensis]|uniref:HAD superfamily hydrolase (TIGR01509 family) n=1 Tax=Aminobacter carboxidus TaxID=376165 RepID=A0A8E1WHK4_9HYPH|nr:HAD family phosphatase [Aminobacter lissarensis]MBB6468528.1 HAD superfamily hydrolase (TIGR01509 family) [Aminobacter lissarensis]
MPNDSLVIFDCDGVLVDSEPLAALAYVRAYAKNGLKIEAEVISHCVGMKQADIIAKIHQLTGQLLPENATDDIWGETKALFTEQLASTLDIAAFLSRLEVARCVASSSSVERINHSLEVTGLAHYFGPSIFSSSMVKNGKPAPDIFLYAAKKMGFAPERSVVVEDSRYGVQGAVAAGMVAIGYVGGGHTHDGHGPELLAAGAAAVCGSWDEVSAELRERGFV